MPIDRVQSVSRLRIIAGLSAYLSDHGINKHLSAFDMSLILTYLTGEDKEQTLEDFVAYRMHPPKFTVAGGRSS